MRALKYFNKEDLLDLESALFTDAKNFKYCLIQESQKYYYIGKSIHVSNVFQRIRSVLMNNQLNLVAHNLQKTVRSTNLSDWVIAVFTDEDMEDHHIENRLRGFKRLHKAKRYEVHGKENIKLYFLQHRRYHTQVYMSSAIDLTEGQFNSRAKSLMKSRAARIDSSVLKGKMLERYLSVANTALHSATGDWIIREIKVDIKHIEDTHVWVRERNEAFNDLSYSEKLPE